MLSDDYIIGSLVDRILRKKTESGEPMFDKKHRDFKFTFEICTYNDMCENCFASCHHLFSEIKSKLEEKLMHVMTSDEQLVGGLSELLPINLNINISSFRPYRSTRERRIIEAYDPTNYLTYQNVCTDAIFENGSIKQIFNPAIQQWLFFNRIQQVLRRNLEDLSNSKIINLEQENSLIMSRKLLTSAKKQSEFDRLFQGIKTEKQLKSDFTTVSEFITQLNKELEQLLVLKIVERNVLEKAVASFFTYETVLKPQLCQASLPLAVTLIIASNVVPNTDFIKNLFSANKNSGSKIIAEGLERLSKTNAVLKSEIQRSLRQANDRNDKY